jgi:hypothetical protein
VSDLILDFRRIGYQRRVFSSEDFLEPFSSAVHGDFDPGQGRTAAEGDGLVRERARIAGQMGF